MNTTEKLIVKMAAVILACFTFCMSAMAATETVSGAIPFNHAKTGFVLRDVHTTLRCEQCHLEGIFKNTPRNCEGCHSIGSRVAATPKPVNHVQTTNPCDTCHVSATSFLVKSFKHVGISNNCTSCHNQQSLGVVSKPANHFPTLRPCESCHTNTNTFTSWKMDHTGLTSNCSTCHGGQFPGVVGKPVGAAHIATSGDCGVCHNTSTFNGARFDHSASAVSGLCNTCHMGQLTGVISKPALHISTGSANCDGCHTAANTSGFTSFVGGNYNHVNMASPVAAGACSTCHTGQFSGVFGKHANHIPTTAQCDVCHTAANTGNYSTFIGGSFNHAAIGGAACTTCHNGISATGKTSTHIFSTLDCGKCHTQTNTANFTTFLGAIYSHPNPPGVCANCHNGKDATGKPMYHIATSAACDTCHTQTNTSNFLNFLGAVYSHPNPPGVCSTCHNGTAARGKSVMHVATTAACDTCHTQSNTANYTTFLGATYVHPATPGVCSTCHNGATARGKPATHIVTTAACNLCHTKSNTANYTTFLGATYVHPNPPGVCANCHNGATALGKPSWHMATTSACDSCHTQANTGNYTTFLGASGSVDHSTIAAGNCQSCHNGATAKGKTTGHIPTGVISCDSGGCHQKYNGTTVTTFAPGVMNHTITAATRCDVCHNGSYTTQGTMGAQPKVSNHIPTTIIGSLDCTTCHNITVSASVASMSWATERMNHNGAQGMGAPVYCVTCHLKGVTYLGAMDKKSHNGASVAKDCSSSSCHKPLGKLGAAYSRWD